VPSKQAGRLHDIKMAFNGAAANTTPPLSAMQKAACRRLAVLWVCVIVVTFCVYVSVPAFALPRPPRRMGLYFPAWADGGLTMLEAGRLLLLSTVIGAVITAAQDLARPMLGDKLVGEKVGAHRMPPGAVHGVGCAMPVIKRFDTHSPCSFW
jgi:hypothetical protein